MLPQVRMYCGDAAAVLATLEPSSVQLTLTSPSYDDIRNYSNGHSWNLEEVAAALYRVTDERGGLVAWNVQDQCRNNDESGSSHRQVLAFKAAGFKLLQTLILVKDGSPFPGGHYRHSLNWEYCFIFLRGDKPLTVAKIRDKVNRQAGMTKNGAVGRRGKEDQLGKAEKQIKIAPVGYRNAVWTIKVGFNKSASPNDNWIYSKFPAVMSQHLVNGLIQTYSRPGDTVLDCFGGSASSIQGAVLASRHGIYIDLSADYLKWARERLIRNSIHPSQITVAGIGAGAGRPEGDGAGVRIGSARENTPAQKSGHFSGITI